MKRKIEKEHISLFGQLTINHRDELLLGFCFKFQFSLQMNNISTNSSKYRMNQRNVWSNVTTMVRKLHRLRCVCPVRYSKWAKIVIIFGVCVLITCLLFLSPFFFAYSFSIRLRFGRKTIKSNWAKKVLFNQDSS